jgi:hypothetical protein
MADCQVCARKTQLFLCQSCSTDLHDLLRGLAVGQELPNGKRAPSWLEYLQDAAWGRTRLGESARRSTEHSTPLPVNLGASQLLENVNGMLLGWARHICESRGVELPI